MNVLREKTKENSGIFKPVWQNVIDLYRNLDKNKNNQNIKNSLTFIKYIDCVTAIKVQEAVLVSTNLHR